MTSKIKLPKRLSIWTIDKVLEQLVEGDLSPKHERVQYDLTDLEFIDATGITVFSNLIEWLLLKNISQGFSIPNKRSGPVSFLDDSLFFERYVGKKLFDKAKPRETTIPLKLIQHPQSHLWVENHCIGWLSRKLKTSKNSLIELRICLLELFNNIKDHSGLDVGCIFVQHYPATNKIQISMSDFGVGIPANVKKIYPKSTDGQAVLMAMKEGFTTNSTGKNMGAGLYVLSQLVINNGGDLAIRSGRAHVLCNQDGISDRSDGFGFYPGTLIDISLRTDRFDSTLADEEDFEW